MNPIELAIEPHIEAGFTLRRFRWVLSRWGESSFPSPGTYATKREALKEGEVALGRARDKGRIRA